MPILRLEHVTKRYGKYIANSDITFTVEQGTLMGVLGPNGAGKTTLLRMITRILVPDEGRILFRDEPLVQEHQSLIGYVPEERGLYRNLTVMENLCYFGQLKGLSKHQCSRYAYQWLDRMHAREWDKKKIRELSKGMSQKIQFIAAILHSPPLLVLDEPFSGLDPINLELFLDVIAELRRNGTTVLLSTHVMEQVERLCEDIILINQGRIVEHGNLRHIKARYGVRRLKLEFDGQNNFLQCLENATLSQSDDGRVIIELTGGIAQAQHIIATALQHTTLLRAECIEPSLHEIFLDTVQRSHA